jgi:hypothetical protein
MILDLQTMFSGVVSAAGVKTGDAVTATAISANVLDLRQSNSLLLADEGLNPDETWLIVQSDASAAWTAAGAATLTITLESDSTANLATTPVVHWSSAAIGKAAILASTVLARIPLPSADYQRYLGLRYTVATGPFTAGAILAYLTPDVQRNKTYPSGFTIDA